MTIARAKRRQPVQSERRFHILAAAAIRFSAEGFAATSMRDIAADTGILAGSIYHHFPSKDAMLVEAYRLGVDRIIAGHDTALTGVSGIWARLEAACVAHLEALLTDDAFAALLTLDLRTLSEALRRQLVVERDRYERRFVGLVKALDVSSPTDERFVRMMLLGALNWTPIWYRRGGASPRRIAATYVRALRDGPLSGKSSRPIQP